MRRYLAFMSAAAVVSFALLPAAGASAMTVGSASGIQQGLAETSAVEKVVRVCRHRFWTSRRECYVDRSRPPTVCHHIRSTSRRDCY
jgi:hypothetical protein